MFTVFGKMNCKEATMLASKKEEGKISLMERIKLFYHYKMCVYCKRFEEHTKVLSRKAKEANINIKMPEPAKNEVKKSLKAN